MSIETRSLEMVVEALRLFAHLFEGIIKLATLAPRELKTS